MPLPQQEITGAGDSAKQIPTEMQEDNPTPMTGQDVVAPQGDKSASEGHRDTVQLMAKKTVR